MTNRLTKFIVSGVALATAITLGAALPAQAVLPGEFASATVTQTRQYANKLNAAAVVYSVTTAGEHAPNVTNDVALVTVLIGPTLTSACSATITNCVTISAKGPDNSTIAITRPSGTSTGTTDIINNLSVPGGIQFMFLTHTTFPAGSKITVTIKKGSFTAPATGPASLIAIATMSSSTNSENASLSIPFTTTAPPVTPARTTPTLPDTGFDAAPLMTVGAVLLMLGLALMRGRARLKAQN